MAEDTEPVASTTIVETAPGPAERRVRSPLRRRNFALLFAGQLISALGDQAYGIALPWTVLAVTRDVRQVAVVLTAGAVPRMFALLLGGALADRLSPRLVMLVTDAARTAVVAALGLTLFVALPPLWVVAALAALEGLGTGFFQPSFPAITPVLVPADELPAANGMMMIVQFLALVIGPLLGGVATAAQASTAFLADAASFLISFITLGAIRLPRRVPDASIPRQRLSASIGDGLRYTLAQPLLRTTIIVSTLGNFGLSGVASLSLIVLSRNLSPSALTLGVLFAAVGVGGILGGLAAGLVSRLKRRGLVVALLWPFVSLVFAAVPFAAGPAASHLAFLPDLLAPDLRIPALAVLLGLIGILLAFGDTVLVTIMQQKMDPNYLGRVFSVQQLAGGISSPLSLLAAGFVTAAFGPGVAFFAGAAIFVPASALALLSRDLRHA
jgi:predicted MFS family arabinose efflux permease